MVNSDRRIYKKTTNNNNKKTLEAGGKINSGYILPVVKGD